MSPLLEFLHPWWVQGAVLTESHQHYDRCRRSISYPVGLKGKNATVRAECVHNKASIFICDGIEMATFDPIFKK